MAETRIGFLTPAPVSPPVLAHPSIPSGGPAGTPSLPPTASPVSTTSSPAPLWAQTVPPPSGPVPDGLLPLEARARDALGRLSRAVEETYFLYFSPFAVMEACASGLLAGSGMGHEEFLLSSGRMNARLPVPRRSREKVEDIWRCINVIQIIGPRPLDVGWACSVHGNLLGAGRYESMMPGSPRDCEVMDGCADWRSLPQAPEASAVAGLLRDWEAQVLAPEASVFRAAVAHGMFELIRPFRAGNGKTARMLLCRYLAGEAFTSETCCFMSSWILEHRDGYEAALGNLARSGDWTAWCGFLLEAVADCCDGLVGTIGRIRSLHERMVGLLGDYPMEEDVMALKIMMEYPVFSVPELKSIVSSVFGLCISSAPVKRMAAAGIIEMVQPASPGRPALWRYADYPEIFGTR